MKPFLKAAVWSVVAFVVFGFVVGNTTFSSILVCDRCGATLQSEKHQVPLTRITLWERRSVSPTPLSSALAAKGVVTNCPHSFVLVQGGGNGVRCALGSGDSILTTALSTDVARLIADLAEYASAGEAMGVTSNLIGIKNRPELLQVQWAMLHDYPGNGFTNADRFRSWWSDRKIAAAETRASFTEQMTDLK